MRLHLLSQADGGPSPPWLLALVCVAIAACAGDSPLEPSSEPVPLSAEGSANRGPQGGDKIDEGAMSIEDMLSDPFFLSAVHGVEAPSLVGRLTDIVHALSNGQTSKASGLISLVAGEVDELEDDPEQFESVFYWSQLELFFEAAELI